MSSLLLRVVVLLALAIVGCGSGKGTNQTGGGPGECQPGEMALDNGGCQPAGLPPDTPAPGVPPEACGQGFEPDGNGGCNAILPAAPCPPGQMAVPGDTQCHEVAPCGSGTWGDIPVEPNTQFVDQTYAGGNSDGSQQHPWTTIKEGVAHAAPTAIVAVAAGSYHEDVLIQAVPVRLWGRCPAMVEVMGTGAALAALQVLFNSTSNSEIHALAITGPADGLSMTGAKGVIVDHVWIHDTASDGLHLENAYGPTSVTAQSSLIEAATSDGVYVAGSQATIESTVVRATRPRGDGTGGRGLEIVYNDQTLRGASATIRTSLVEQNHEVGVYVAGAQATIESIVVRGTLGHGIGIENAPAAPDADRTAVTLRASLVEQNQEAGVLVIGSDATIETTIVRATQPRSDGTIGDGILVEDVTSKNGRATMTLRASVVEQNHEVGVGVKGSDATIETTIVRGTEPDGDGTLGDGIVITAGSKTHAPANVTLRTSLVEQNHEVGVLVSGSAATVEATVVRETQGYGISIEVDPSTHASADVTLRTSLVEDNRQVGVFVSGSAATIEATVVRGSQPDDQGTRGQGIAIQDDAQGDRATATLRSLLVEKNHQVGIVVLSSDATIESTVVRETLPDSQGFGDGFLITDGRSNSPSNATITSTRTEANARAGVLFDNSKGSLSDVVSTNNQYGLVLQGKESPEYESGDDQLTGNTKQDIYTGGDLAVPDSASPVPSSP